MEARRQAADDNSLAACAPQNPRSHLVDGRSACDEIANAESKNSKH